MRVESRVKNGDRENLVRWGCTGTHTVRIHVHGKTSVCNRSMALSLLSGGRVSGYSTSAGIITMYDA